MNMAGTRIKFIKTDTNKNASGFTEVMGDNTTERDVISVVRFYNKRGFELHGNMSKSIVKKCRKLEMGITDKAKEL